MFACCFRGPPRAEDDEMPGAAPPATHLKGAAPKQQEVEDEGFTILT